MDCDFSVHQSIVRIGSRPGDCRNYLSAIFYYLIYFLGEAYKYICIGRYSFTETLHFFIAILLSIPPGKERELKLIFNDATELTIQSATIRTDGSLLIKSISATEEELRSMFQDEFKTKKMTVTERESTVATYENYTNLNALVKYIGGILGVVIYREKESPMDRIDALEEHVDNLTEANKSREAETAELIATVDSILTDVLPALIGDGTEETQ